MLPPKVNPRPDDSSCPAPHAAGFAPADVTRASYSCVVKRDLTEIEFEQIHAFRQPLFYPTLHDPRYAGGGIYFELPLDTMKEFHRSDRHSHFVLLSDPSGTLLGYSRVSFRPAESNVEPRLGAIPMVEVVFIGVAEEYRSRHIDFGKRSAKVADIMLEAIEDWARAQGAAFLFSDIVTGPDGLSVKNEASIKFHLRNGFHLLGAGHLSCRSPVRDGVTLELSRYCKSLK